MIPYILPPILSASSCRCTLQTDSMVLSGYDFVGWNRSSPSSASHLCTKHGVACWMSGHCCRSALNESQRLKLYLATLGGYICLFCLWARANPSPVACWLAFPYSSPPEPRLDNSWEPSQPNVAKSIRHDQWYPKAAWSRRSRTIVQPRSSSTCVYDAAVRNSTVPRYRTDASSPDTQPPIVSSTYWRHSRWAAASCCQIASRRILFASSWLGLCLQPKFDELLLPYCSSYSS